MMNSKAPKDDVENLKLSKTNKTDTENLMKAIDILHRQIKHLIVLLTEVAQHNTSD